MVVRHINRIDKLKDNEMSDINYKMNFDNAVNTNDDGVRNTSIDLCADAFIEDQFNEELCSIMSQCRATNENIARQVDSRIYYKRLDGHKYDPINFEELPVNQHFLFMDDDEDEFADGNHNVVFMLVNRDLCNTEWMNCTNGEFEITRRKCTDDSLSMKGVKVYAVHKPPYKINNNDTLKYLGKI